MEIVEHIKVLRSRLMNLNQQYLDGMRAAKPLLELQGINDEINALVDLIQNLEKQLANPNDRNDTWV
jgi:hypothetical protein